MIQFLDQAHTDFDTFHKAAPLMASAEGTDRVKDFVHVLQGHPIHLLIEPVKCILDRCIVHAVAIRQLLSRGKITFYSLIFMEWAMNCKVCVLWALW